MLSVSTFSETSFVTVPTSSLKIFAVTVAEVSPLTRLIVSCVSPFSKLVKSLRLTVSPSAVLNYGFLIHLLSSYLLFHVLKSLLEFYQLHRLQSQLLPAHTDLTPSQFDQQ